MPIKINIAGDFVVTDEFHSNNLIDTPVLNHFNVADLNIVNLEAPITANIPENKILKTGPHLRGSADLVAPILTCLNVNLVTLANNHLLDYGKFGLSDTLGFCQEIGIETVGGGMSLKNAKLSWRKEIKGVKISVINFAENEWASASDSTAGANPMELIDNVKQIQQEKKKADFVFVIIHGGHEHYNLPSPRMQKQYRFYAENGADLIVGHHTHCISGYEIFNGVPIYYSLGNFLFTKSSVHEDWYQGLVLSVSIDRNKKLTTKINFVNQHKDTHHLTLLTQEKLYQIENKFNEYSDIIRNEVLLKNKWDLYVDENMNKFKYYLSPIIHVNNDIIRKILYKIKLNGFTKEGASLLLNLVRCEAHYDLSKSVMKKFIME